MEQGKTFEPSTPYLQEENGMFEKIGKTIMDMM